MPGPQGWRTAGWGEGLWTAAFLFLEQVPTSGTQRLLPFPAWKTPSVLPRSGLWSLEEETRSPQGQRPSPGSRVSSGPGQTQGHPGQGSCRLAPVVGKEGVAAPQPTRSQAQPGAVQRGRALGPSVGPATEPLPGNPGSGTKVSSRQQGWAAWRGLARRNAWEKPHPPERS
ncbi:unnamed protein product [Rangifer tarandus platyrhynchus]|uniref:Uncharacterized protein n=1 Tax=Rangifer tarandus platyrhynchus TaxID=3082113 RepID=A0AC59ZW26_RANTA